MITEYTRETHSMPCVRASLDYCRIAAARVPSLLRRVPFREQRDERRGRRGAPAEAGRGARAGRALEPARPLAQRDAQRECARAQSAAQRLPRRSQHARRAQSPPRLHPQAAARRAPGTRAAGRGTRRA